MTVTFILFGAPCGGNYECESSWPPPKRIRAVHDGNGYQAVLDLPDEVPLLGESVVEYELSSYGYACRGRGSYVFATYMRAGLAPQAQAREVARDLRHLEAVGS